VALDLNSKLWLDALLAEELERYDPDAARSRLPSEVSSSSPGTPDLAPAARVLVARSMRHRRLDAAPADAADTFAETVRAHIGLALDLALLRGEPFVRADRRAEIAAFFAAAVGEADLAVAVEPQRPGGASDRAVARALRAAGDALALRFEPPGDPAGGLPLYPGTVAVFRRHLARVAMGYLRRGRLDEEALARHAEFAERELVFLAEALAGLDAAAAAPGDRARLVRGRQLTRLGLSRRALREVRRAVQAPRPAAQLAAAAPERIRSFLLEQLLLAQLRARLGAEPAGRYVDAFVEGGRIEAQTLVGAQVEAAAQHGDHQVWFEAFGDGVPHEWQRLADEWEEVADHMVERVSAAVTENLDAVVTEIRETGELGQLLARAAAGHALTREEKKKVKSQLLDLAKAVPALAIFAAPGGMLLLPLLAKLLPFNVLPGAWDKDAPKVRAAAREAGRRKRRPEPAG